MKYSVIAALVVAVFILIYVRLRPYLQLIRKVINSLNAQRSINVGTTSSPARSRGEHKLLRCESCGTWIPAERALKLSSGLATYCSRECLEKNAGSKERRAAG